MISRYFLLSLLVASSALGFLHEISTPDDHQVDENYLLLSLTQQIGALAQTEHHRHLQSVTIEEHTALQQLCTRVEQSFNQNVTCQCVGALQSNSFSMSCQYNEQICGPLDSVCGKPLIALTIVQGGVFSATSCVSDYINKKRNLQYEDTCVSMELCDSTVEGGFCGCTVSYGGHLCQQCSVCNGGKGVEIDCTNINAEAVSQTCRNVDTDLNLAGGAGVIAGFLPNFEGLCSQLEDGTSNRVSCNCDNSGGGTYEVTCETIDVECRANVCGSVKTTVFVTTGEITSIETCADLTQPYDFKPTCTTLELCNKYSGDESICGCTATYDGKTCSKCSVCNSGLGVTLDCTNISPVAYIDQCQAVSSSTSYEFIPDYPTVTVDATSSACQCLVQVSFGALLVGIIFLL